MSISVWATVHGFSPLINSNIQTSLIYISSLSTTYITALILAAAIAESKSLEKELTNQSNHDHLTGLYNRLFFDAEMERLNDSRQFPISVVMADVDHLKKVNDRLGHDRGDQVLKNIALLFDKVFRKEDIVARLSGDEFAVLLPSTNLPSLRRILKRVHFEISAFNRTHQELPIHLSFGYCRAHKQNRIEDCLKNADKLMYLEKQKNKKRC
jgi:diguanylate cyclase (GGDEF)-like protein